MKATILAVLALGICAYAEMKAPPIPGTIVRVRERDLLSEAKPQAPGEPAQSTGKACELYIKGQNGMMYHAQLMKGCDDPSAKNWKEGATDWVRPERKNRLSVGGQGQTTSSLDLLDVSQADKASEPANGNMRVLTTAPPKKKQ